MTEQSPYNEVELLTQVAEGDEDAFRIIYEKYWQKIYSVALTYLKSPVTAQDIVQEVFMKIWTKRADLHSIENFAAYIHIISRNLVFSTLRKKLPLPLKDSSDQSEEKIWKPAEQLETKETAQQIQTAIRQLTPAQQQVYRLAKERGLSLKEVADELGISYNTVREHMSRSLKSIRNYLLENLYSLIPWCSVFIFM